MTNFETVLRGTISNSATKAQQREATADVELLLRRGVPSIRALIDFAQNSRLKSDVRSAACWALGQLKDPHAVPVLISLLERAGPQLGWEAAKSLVALLSDKRKGSRKLKQALSQGRGPHNRAAAAYVLGLTGDRSSIRRLVEVLRGSDTPEVRSHAAEALGNIGDSSTANALIFALDDLSPKVRLAAAYALGEAGDERAIEPLKRLASAKLTQLSKYASVRTEAKKAIKRIQQRGASE
jgi:HEAT repeat protein